MIDLIFNILFVIVSFYIFIKTIFYAIYEIKAENNKTGGIGVIAFSMLITIFSNIIVFIRWNLYIYFYFLVDFLY